MATVAFAFGSFGDIITVIQLATSIIKTLQNSTDAPREYNELVEEIETFKLTLLAIHSTLDPNDDLPTPATNALTYAVSRCHNILLQMEQDMSKYAKDPSKSQKIEPARRLNSRARLKNVLRWIFGGKDGMEAYKRRLSEQMIAINIAMAAAGRCVTGSRLCRRSDV